MEIAENKKHRLVLLCAAWLAAFLFLLPSRQTGLSATFLDVGQGDGIVLRSESHTILVDCGSSQQKSIGEKVLVPYLKSQGVTRLDLAVMTHGDQDHMNGIRYLLEHPESGIRVGIGTDGAASNNRLNMFTEMGRAALLHKAAGDPETMPARAVLDMATRGGAAAMGGDGGVLAVGRAADCIALDLSAPNMQPLFNAASHAVYAATGMEVALTMRGPVPRRPLQPL